MRKCLFVLLFGVIYIQFYGQDALHFNPHKYLVSPQISQQIKKYAFADTGTLKGAMQIQVTWDDKPTFNQKNLDCYTFSFFRHDTIYITGYMIGQLGWGFHLALFRDSCIVSSYALSDGYIYKHNTSDSVLLSLITLPSISQKLVLLAKPTFTAKERISGFVELRSQDFYYIMDKSKRKSNLRITAFFKTALIEKY